MRLMAFAIEAIAVAGCIALGSASYMASLTARPIAWYVPPNEIDRVLL